MKRNKIINKYVIGVLIIIIFFSCLSSKDNAEYAKANVRKVLNEENMASFVNGYFQDKMKEYCIPGASIVVVKENKVLFKAGYGYSDIKNKTEVNPDTTTFPACSVSKLFTASAIMQLYNAGRIDIDKNVEEYLGEVKIHNSFKNNVTCRNLLTHTSGLDEASEIYGSSLKKNDIKSQKYILVSISQR